MTNLPTRDAILDNQIITSDWKTYYGNIRDFINQMLGGAEPEVCLVIEESISPSKAVISLDLDELVTESLLKNISITNYSSGQWIFLILNNPEKKITLAHGQPGDGAIYTFSQQNEQVSESDVIVLRRSGNNWQQVDLFAYSRATDEELDEGTSKFKSPTVAQLKPYLSNATSSAMGVVVYALRKPEGTLKCDQTEYQLDTFPQLAEYLKGGQLPTTTFEDYASQSSSNGFCEKFALDEASGKFKCPNLESQKIGETTYNAYVAVYNTVTAESLIQLQGILDQCLSVQIAINEKGEEITNYVNSSLQELESKKDECLQNIKDQEVSSLETLTSATNTHIGELDDKKDICIAEVEAKRDEITTEGQTQVDRVIQTGNSQVTYVQQTGADVIADSRTWATGEDIEVNELEEGEHSSRGYADLSAAFAETDEDVPIADSPLMALQSIAGPKGDPGLAATISVGTVTTGNAGTNAAVTNTGTTNAAVFNFVIPKGDKGDQGITGPRGEQGPAGDLSTNRITNCLTEIPQNINLELSNGVLTLKAGSKAYVPNNVGVFNELVIQEDKTALLGNTDGQYFLFVRDNGEEVFCNQLVSEAISGTIPPSLKGLFYNTEENKIVLYDEGILKDESFSLPLAIVTISEDKVISIDQVFNGFGYIGSTIFALPGIEGLIPNGRNTDGSLNNTKFTTANVLTKTETSALSGNIGLNASTIQNFTTAYYDDKSNLVLNSSGVNLASALCGTYVRGESGRITSFQPKLPFQAIDRNDTEWISTQGKPSNRYDDLTLGASGASYTAPANGYFSVRLKSTASNQYISCNVKTPEGVTILSDLALSTSSNQAIGLWMPILKGQIFNVVYTTSNEVGLFKFIYDEGVA